MEKKTIGKFISVLRKANGMTQRELGEKLFVSDKTVSRWECDECTPDLSLIPTIAEIFGITTDELLRGERNSQNKETEVTEETVAKQKSKSDKQFKLMLDKKSRKYKNLTLISVGITILGFIIALIVNLGFAKGFIAFCIASAFCVASEICQICFCINARVMNDDDDDTYNDKIRISNNKSVEKAVSVTFFNIIMVAVSLPLAILTGDVNYGLQFDSWLCYGLLFAFIVLALSHIIYVLFVHRSLCKRGVIVPSEKEDELNKKNKKLLLKAIAVLVAVELVLCVAILCWDNFGYDVFTAKELTFDNCEDFKARMESDYEAWYNEGYGYTDEYGNKVHFQQTVIGSENSPLGGDENYDELYHSQKVTKELKNAKGEVICTYYYNPDIYFSISFTETADDKMPVKVVTIQSYYEKLRKIENIESLLYTLMGVSAVCATVLYLFKRSRNNKKAKL